MSARSIVTAVTSVVTVALLAAGCATTDDTGDSPRARQVAGETASQVAGVEGRRVEVVAVGDIACRPGLSVSTTSCRHAEVAALTRTIDPQAVLAVGDLQYDSGTLEDFKNSYDLSWGSLKDITYPTPGNHEYYTGGAAGYYSYFSDRTPPAPGYYSFTLGKWRAYSLNGNCEKIDCDQQAEWFRTDLSSNPSRCSIVATHFPRYSSGNHGANDFMRRFYRIADRHGVDVIVTGHDHHYERFRRMNHRGEYAKRGVMSFISGAGGKSHYAATGNARGSEYVDDDTFGVLRLVLRPDDFKFAFWGIDGSRQDSGTRSCR